MSAPDVLEQWRSVRDCEGTLDDTHIFTVGDALAAEVRRLRDALVRQYVAADDAVAEMEIADTQARHDRDELVDARARYAALVDAARKASDGHHNGSKSCPLCALAALLPPETA